MPVTTLLESVQTDQVVQLMSVSGGGPAQQPVHQLTAINNYLLHLETAQPSTRLPPFSTVSRLGITCFVRCLLIP